MKVLATERDFKPTQHDPLCVTPIDGGVCDAPKHHHMRGVGACTITACQGFTWPAPDAVSKLADPTKMATPANVDVIAIDPAIIDSDPAAKA